MTTLSLVTVADLAVPAMSEPVERVFSR